MTEEERGVPDASAAGGGVPGNEAPDVEAPGGAVPGGAVPDAGVHGDAASVDAVPVAPSTSPIRAWVDARFRSAPAIYGLIVFAAFVAVDSDHAVDSWDILETAAWTLVVFYIAHVFAHTLTDHGKLSLPAATWRAMRHSSGMLYASIPAAITLIVCGVQGTSPEDAYGATMWTTTAVLAVLGYLAYWRRGAHPLVRVIGAVGTAFLGVFIVLLEYAIH